MKRMTPAVLVAVFLLCGVVLAVSAWTGTVPVGNWGLSFSQTGAAPAGPVSPEKLAELDGAYLDRDGGKVLYLTFDAGYENGYMPQILDVLLEQQVPAAFFLVGDYLERNADLVRRMAREGHIVGNHTMNHPDMSQLAGEDFTRELVGMEELFLQTTGRELDKFYRPPQGVYSEGNLKQAQELGYKTVFWSLAHVDWNNGDQPDPDGAVEKLNSRVHDGAVVLLHATSKTNAEILDRLISGWKDMGYRFAPLTELFSEGPDGAA